MFLWASCAESYPNLMKNIENMSKISLIFKSNMSFNALTYTKLTNVNYVESFYI